MTTTAFYDNMTEWMLRLRAGVAYGAAMGIPEEELTIRRFIGSKINNDLFKKLDIPLPVSALGFGLQWREYTGPLPPPKEKMLSNVALSEALKHRREFTSEEWRKFDVKNLKDDNFVQSEEKYFQPVVPEKNELNGFLQELQTQYRTERTTKPLKNLKLGLHERRKFQFRPLKTIQSFPILRCQYVVCQSSDESGKESKEGDDKSITLTRWYSNAFGLMRSLFGQPHANDFRVRKEEGNKYNVTHEEISKVISKPFFGSRKTYDAIHAFWEQESKLTDEQKKSRTELETREKEKWNGFAEQVEHLFSEAMHASDLATLTDRIGEAKIKQTEFEKAFHQYFERVNDNENENRNDITYEVKMDRLTALWTNISEYRHRLHTFHLALTDEHKGEDAVANENYEGDIVYADENIERLRKEVEKAMTATLTTDIYDVCNKNEYGNFKVRRGSLMRGGTPFEEYINKNWGDVSRKFLIFMQIYMEFVRDVVKNLKMRGVEIPYEYESVHTHYDQIDQVLKSQSGTSTSQPMVTLLGADTSSLQDAARAIASAYDNLR